MRCNNNLHNLALEVRVSLVKRGAYGHRRIKERVYKYVQIINSHFTVLIELKFQNLYP